VNFSNVPATSNLPVTDFPSPDRFDALPTVAIVVPDLDHDMHNGSIAAADAWLRDHLDAYVQWAATHNSLFILTWDESNNQQSNGIPTLFVGPMVKPGWYSEPLNHLHLLRTLEDLYGLPYAGESANVGAIVDVWVDPPPESKDQVPEPRSDETSGKCGMLGIGAVVAAVLARRLLRRD
jgi:acid phosphatase